MNLAEMRQWAGRYMHVTVRRNLEKNKENLTRKQIILRHKKTTLSSRAALKGMVGKNKNFLKGGPAKV